MPAYCNCKDHKEHELFQQQRRVDAGIQCPECFGVRILPRYDEIGYRNGFGCQECGCQWGRR